MRLIFSFLLLLVTSTSFASVVNVYGQTTEIPPEVISQFEKETGITVNFSTFDSNEILYTKLKMSDNPGYDVIMPSSYYVERLAREKLLQALDKKVLSNSKNIDPVFLNPPYDPHNEYSIPFIFGVTGIFNNKNYFPSHTVEKWSDFWQPRFKNTLLLFNDTREVFSMALLSLGYSANDNNPDHIRQAYTKLRELLPNIKLFNNTAIPSIYIDEDVTIGMAWNAELANAKLENNALEFIFPKDGFIIWVDTLAIPKSAPHLNNAYKFINFMLRADIAKQSTLTYGASITNRAAKLALPPKYQENLVIFPPAQQLKKGQFQRDVSDNALAIYSHYWELLKLGN